MSTDHPFVRKHPDKIAAVLGCFDRVIFRGYLPICHVRGLHGWLHQRGVKYWNFKQFAPQLAERLLQHAKDTAAKAGRPYQYLAERVSKDELARQIAARDGVSEGLVCVFSCLETCRTFRLRYGEGKPRLTDDLRRCTVLYYFFLDPDCGLIHIKLHAWLPLTCQVYVNGHSWLERQLDKRGLGYAGSDNALVQLDDAAATQKVADRFWRWKWRRRLDRWARLVNPLLKDLLRFPDGEEFSYYWTVDQAEYSTDVIFRDRTGLEELYGALVEHAGLHFSSEDVLRFLGHKAPGSMTGEVQTERKKLVLDDKERPHRQRPLLERLAAAGRVEGVRVKHVCRSNRLKMYNKAGVVLRIETVINDPTRFRVRRWQTNKHGGQELSWQPLRKGVAWLWRYAQVCQSANSRYLAALAVVHDPGPARKLLDRASRPAPWRARRRRALQPLSPQDQALFLAALRGEHHVHGLCNADLAQQLYGPRPQDAIERRRRCGRVTRLIQLLRAHGLLAKIPRSRRYRVTAAGQQLMSAAIYVRHKYLPNELHNIHKAA
jgi:hypothetical protein